MMELNLKSFLTTGSAPAVGRFGEYLFYKLITSKNQGIEKRHSKGVDFFLDGLGSIDVKVVRNFESRVGERFRRISKSHQLDGVIYAYIIFRINACELVYESQSQSLSQFNQDIDELMLLEVWENFDKKNIKLKNQKSEDYKLNVKRELSSWIRRNWNKTAKIIQRGDKARNDLMMRRGWGADNFYCSSENFDIIVLLNFDMGQVYKVYAYPIGQRDEIEWRPKNIGTNVQRITGWNPLEISKKFIFEDLDTFKTEFPNRFFMT